tara:strand:- start:44592 stop:44864 length:273 start_codon:yes stop_codon:yes gene_type:complete
VLASVEVLSLDELIFLSLLEVSEFLSYELFDLIESLADPWLPSEGSRDNIRARLIAVDSARWCLGQTPVFLEDSILFWSEIYLRSVLMSL